MSIIPLETYELNNFIVTLIEGELKNHVENGITVNPLDENKNISVIASHDDCEKIILDMLSAPVIPKKEIKLFSIDGELINTWNIGRKNNFPYNTPLKKKRSTLFSNINFSQHKGIVYLLFPSYEEIDSCVFNEIKRELILRDLHKMLENKTDSTNDIQLSLIISKNRLEEFDFYGICADDFFNKITVSPDERKKSKAFIEIICGESIGKHGNPFETLLFFGDNVDVLEVKNCHIFDGSVIVGSKIKGGIDLKSDIVISFRIVVVLKYSGKRPNSFNYQDNEHQFVYNDSVMSNDLIKKSMEMLEYFYYMKTLEDQDRLNFVISSPLTSFYTYSNPISELSKSNISNLISSYFLYVYESLSSHLMEMRDRNQYLSNPILSRPNFLKKRFKREEIYDS
uniref:Uncharacterized protein n=1 Tax=viral metagenome TaxID=1070528 RepID=A0A6C0BE19_9ZZZZ